jgi:hypothetical protein
MNHGSRGSIEREVKRILQRHDGDQRRLVTELTALVLKAHKEGERRERGRHDDGDN